ncbi:hypothetical protein BX666DRAFT_632639 [Dichotomocladium elegans]|nr:hypothetical protein BX666DRAFT_632639 [Dichotomocladium elegans]
MQQAARLRNAKQDEEEIIQRMKDREYYRQKSALESTSAHDSAQPELGESTRDFLIRTGKITPFTRVPDANAKAEAGPSGSIFLPGSNGSVIERGDHAIPLSAKEFGESGSDVMSMSEDDNNDDDYEPMPRRGTKKPFKPKKISTLGKRRAISDEEYELSGQEDEEDLHEVTYGLVTEKKALVSQEDMLEDDGDEAVYQAFA